MSTSAEANSPSRDLPEIAIRVRNDGEEFELSIEGVFVKVFDSFETAVYAGILAQRKPRTVER